MYYNYKLGVKIKVHVDLEYAYVRMHAIVASLHYYYLQVDPNFFILFFWGTLLLEPSGLTRFWHVKINHLLHLHLIFQQGNHPGWCINSNM